MKRKEPDTYVERPKKRPPKTFPALDAESSTDDAAAAAAEPMEDAELAGAAGSASSQEPAPIEIITPEDDDKENIPNGKGSFILNQIAKAPKT